MTASKRLNKDIVNGKNVGVLKFAISFYLERSFPISES